MKEVRYYALNLHSSAVIELGVMKESEAYPTLRKKIITECETIPSIESIECDYYPVGGEKAKEAENEGGWFKVVQFDGVDADHVTLRKLSPVFVLINTTQYPKFRQF